MSNDVFRRDDSEAQRLEALEREQITDTPQDEAFDRIVRLACTATDTPLGAISFVDEARQWFKARVGLDSHETPREQAFCAHALVEDHVLVVEDATRDPRFAANPLVTCADGIRFYAGAPLKTREGFTLGTLCVIDRKPRHLTPRDLAMLEDMAAIVVNELDLRKRMGTDMLTGLYTRRFIDELGTREIARARREKKPLTAAIIDADRFKSINDDFGHPAGDAVLRALGMAVKTALRTTDMSARYGGEELVVLLPGTQMTQAAPVLERLRASIEALSLPQLKGRRVTASIGVAQLTDGDTNIDDLLARADAALYRAKQDGRNRVTLAVAA
jgi:diguanylate cyclase (GGDEF)-like protein